jgi:hypothetical protein
MKSLEPFNINSPLWMIGSVSQGKKLDSNARLMIGLFTALFVAIVVQKLL